MRFKIIALALALALLAGCAATVDREALWDAGGLAHHNGWWEDCIRYTSRFSRLFPDDPRAPHAVLLRGFCQFHSGNYDAAISSCGWVETYHRDTPFCADAMFLRGLTYARLGGPANMDAAKRTLESMIKTFPNFEMCPVAQKVIEGIDTGLTWDEMDAVRSPESRL